MNKIDIIINALESAYEDKAGWCDKVDEALYAVRELQAESSMLKMPTKIFGPNLEEILNAAGFYRQPKQKPVAWLYNGNFHIFDPSDWAIEPESVQPLYTTPSKREWVGLTDDEIKGILDCGRGGLVDIRKAEQFLKEKNSGDN